jgi:glycosyltransferase involved in cell wall biosynthesis
MVFTVIIPTRNRPASLIEAIKSVQSQTFKEWEIIIVDDASDMDIKKEIEPYLSEKIKYVRNDKSLGPGGTRNAGIRLAHQESIYLSLLDDDDIYFPEFLRKTYQGLQNTGEDIGFCWTGIENFYPHTDQRTPFFWDPPFDSKEAAFQGFLEKRLIGTGYGITFKKAVFKEVGFFDESLRAVEDTDFFLRVLKSFFYIKIPDTLVRITRHPSNHVNSDSLDRAEALQRIYKKHRESILQNKVAWYNFKAKISSMYYRLGNKKMARQILASTLRERFSLRILILWLKLEMKWE